MKIRCLTVPALFFVLLVGACGGPGPPPPAPACLPGGAGCQSFADCCSGTCRNYVCTGGGCLGGGNPCSYGYQCCSGFCNYGSCTCLPNGAGCGNDNQCCSGNCQNNVVCRP
jgi:hypothetical protein